MTHTTPLRKAAKVKSLQAYHGERITESTDLYTSQRLRRAVRLLDIDAVLTAHEQLAVGNNAGVSPEFTTIIKDLDKAASRFIGKAGNYWLAAVDPDFILLDSRSVNRNTDMDDGFYSTLALGVDEAGELTTTKTGYFGIGDTEGTILPIEYDDGIAISRVITGLHDTYELPLLEGSPQQLSSSISSYLS